MDSLFDEENSKKAYMKDRPQTCKIGRRVLENRPNTAGLLHIDDLNED